MLESVDNPLVDNIRELVECNILILLFSLREFAPYFNLTVNEHTGESDVTASAADTLAHFVRLHIDLDLVVRTCAHIDG